MAYTPQIIATGNYGDIRLALGLDSDDTTTVPDALIESLPQLPAAEAVIIRRIPTYATILAGSDDEQINQLKSGTILATAGRLAHSYLAGRTGSELKSQGLGPASVSYRDGPDWKALGKMLLEMAGEMLSQVEEWATASDPVALFGRSGPTRKAATLGTSVSAFAWAERLVPPAARGYEYLEGDDEENG